MMNATELSTIRTKLRAVNVEYSALVREKHRTGRFIRMEALKTERQTLTALLGSCDPDPSEVMCVAVHVSPDAPSSTAPAS